MSLYHHVPNKDALLDGLVEEVLHEIEIPDPTEGSWDQRAARMARSLRRVALHHPGCVPLLVTRPFATGPALRPCEAAIEAPARPASTSSRRWWRSAPSWPTCSGS